MCESHIFLRPHWKKIQVKRGGYSKNKTMNLYSHVGRLKCWKKGSRDPLSCTKRGATSGNNLQKHPQKKERREIQVQILKLDKISGELW